MVERALTRNNVRVTGSPRGGAPTMVFGHGLGTDQRAWRFVAPAFADDRRQVLFDHLGFGGSDLRAYDAARHGTLDGYADDLLDVLEAVDATDVVYVGHSVGGIIGLLASIRQPERFARLVLLGSSPRFTNDAAGYIGGFEPADIAGILDLLDRDQSAWAATLAPLAIGDQGGPSMVRDFGEGLGAIDPLVAQRFGRLAFLVDVRDRLPLVTVPTLVVQCTHDSIVPPEVGRYLHRHLAGSVLSELDASGHCPHLTHPRETVEIVSRYLRDANGHA